MLQSLRIRNYRCFVDHTIPLDNSNIVLVGKNNAGKSTIVETLRLLSIVADRYDGLTFHDPPSWTNLPKQHRGVKPSLRGIELNTNNIFSRYGDPPAQIDAKFKSGASISLLIGPDLDLHAVVTSSRGQILRSRAEAAKTKIPSLTLLPPIGPLSAEERVLNEDYVRKSRHAAIASLHFRNDLQLNRQLFGEFRALVESSWSGVRIQSLEQGGSAREPTLVLMIQDHDFVAEVGWMGHGLQMWLQTMWFLIRAHKSQCIVLDEPDVYMHPDLQRRLIRLLKKRSQQVIIATHSTEIMAEVEASEILVLDRHEPVSRFAATLPAAQEAINSLGSIHNLALARLWSARRCVLVEGKDLGMLRVVQDTLFPDSSESIQALPNYSIGGWGGWSFAIGSSLMLKNAAGDAIITYCILDSDYNTEDEIQRRYKQAAERGVELHIWKRKEIENYFLVPAAIERAIRANVKQFRLDLSIPAVADKLDAFASSMKDDVFDAFAAEYLAANRAAGAAGANCRARDRLGTDWQTREGRLARVSGKQLFTQLARWSQEAFGVSLSVRSIAREMRSEDIDPELASVVTAIERGMPFQKTS